MTFHASSNPSLATNRSLSDSLLISSPLVGRNSLEIHDFYPRVISARIPIKRSSHHKLFTLFVLSHESHVLQPIRALNKILLCVPRPTHAVLFHYILNISVPNRAKP